MAGQTLLLLHPGEMGSAIGARLRANGLTVLWVSQGRSMDTRERADAAGLTEVETLAHGLRGAQLVLSVCPPHGAIDLAREVAQHGFRGEFIDANAIAPKTSAQIQRIVEAAGAHFTDAGIIGPPPAGAAKARMYFSGSQARRLADLFESPPLQAIALPDSTGPNGASALKMCFSGWNKARTALLINLRTLAIHHGVDQALLAEWEQRDAATLGLFDTAKGHGSITDSARKAWRWSGEMQEIATTFKDAELPDHFHLGAAAVFGRLEAFKETAHAPALEELALALKSNKAG